MAEPQARFERGARVQPIGRPKACVGVVVFDGVCGGCGRVSYIVRVGDDKSEVYTLVHERDLMRRHDG